MSKPESATYVESVDSLFGQDITFEDCPWFSKGPPLVLGAKNEKKSLKSLKQKVHFGLPPQLRCAVWIASVVRIVHPHLPIDETDSYGTVGMKNNIEAKWDYALNAVFPNPSDREDAIPPDFGLGQEALNQLIQRDYMEWNTSKSKQSTDVNANAIPEKGANLLALILCTVQQVLGIEYCPPLPDVATILLTHMPESYAFATIREMINDTSHFLPVSQKDYYSWCKTYGMIVKRMFPVTYKAMKTCGALEPEGLEPIFKRFFTTIMKPGDILRFVDIFLVEGCKAVFRLALSLCQLVRFDLKSLILTDSESWWREIRSRTLSPEFSFKKHLNLMYPKFGKVAKRYPNRRGLRRAMKYNERWALENMPIYIDETPPKPMGFTSNECTLAQPASVRSNLAKWLPPSLKSTQLDLIYSTEIHGRSLVAFYNECQRSKNTIVLIEALTGSTRATIGMFASHAWNINSGSYGDGECFLFRSNPNPKCFHWVPDFAGSMDALESQAVSEQFMVAKRDFIAMGANEDGTNGLYLDQELVRGESHPALGFKNEPLPGESHETFDIGVLEVYRLIREIDGKAIGHDDALVWDLEGL